MICGIYSSHPYYRNNYLFDNQLSEDELSLFGPYINLRKYLLNKNVTLNTADFNFKNKLFEDVEIHIDPPTFIEKSNKKKYAILTENKMLLNSNSVKNHFLNFNKVFTWDSNLVDKKKFIFQPIPFSHNYKCNPKINDRSIFISSISANKNIKKNNTVNLYDERLKLYSYYNYRGSDFSLYGRGWDNLIAKSSLPGRLINIFLRKSNIDNILYKYKLLNNFRHVYKGEVDNKFDILNKSKFNIAFENIKSNNLYVTEKIFQSFACGAIPIYYGSELILQFLPKKSYIDYGKFDNIRSLDIFLRKLTDNHIDEMRSAGREFLNSEKFSIFSDDYFIENIFSVISNA